MTRAPHARTRPVPQEGHLYRNGAGMVRRLVRVDGEVAITEVVKPSENPGQRYRAGETVALPLRAFRRWLVAECDEEGQVVPTPGLKRPKPRAACQERFLEAMAEAVLEGKEF